MLFVRNNSKRPIIVTIPTGYTGPQPFYAADRSNKSVQINSGQVTTLANEFAETQTVLGAIEAGELEILKEIHADG